MAKPRKGKKIKRIAKLQLDGGGAKPGPELASVGINMGAFIQEFNAATQDRRGDVVPTVITAYEDKSFDFVTKTTPVSILLKKAANIKKGAKNAKLEKVATISKAKATELAEYKIVDLNANDIQAALKIIEGTARNMGIVIEGVTPSANSQVNEEDITAAKEAAKKAAQAEAAAESAVADAEAAKAAEAEAKAAAEAESGDK